MKAIFKKSFPKGVIKAPPSKSYAHRYLIAGAFSRASKISNVAFSNDIKATLFCLKSLGFIYEIIDDIVTFNGYKKNNDVLDCLESGSTLRFFIPLALILNNEATLIGSEKLFSRGLDTYLDIFSKQNISYKLDKNSLYIKGKLQAGRYDLKVDKSSQFVSGLLFALPLLDEDSEIHLIGKIESQNYIDITLDTLNLFGIDFIYKDNVIYIKGNQKYLPKDLEVEGDYSNSSFLEALNYIGGDVKITGLNPTSKQGDKKYLQYFPILKNSHPIIDISNSIDLGPVLFTFASIFNGATFKGIERLRIKESDRVLETLKILGKYNVKYILKNDELEISKSTLTPYQEEIDMVNDHRIVMATSILLILFGGSMNHIEAVNKSYPNYFIDLKKLNVEVELYE